MTLKRWLNASAALLITIPQFAAAETCPTSDFSEFLTLFSADPAMQQKYTADPLAYDWLDVGADPEPAKVSEMVPHSELDWPVLQGLNQQQSSFTWKIAAPDAESRVLFLLGTDNGINEMYYFEARPCWTLVRIDSDST